MRSSPVRKLLIAVLAVLLCAQSVAIAAVSIECGNPGSVAAPHVHDVSDDGHHHPHDGDADRDGASASDPCCHPVSGLPLAAALFEGAGRSTCSAIVAIALYRFFPDPSQRPPLAARA